MTVQLNRQLFTVADYYKMAEAGILSDEQRYELLNGEIIKMSPQRSPHAFAIDFLSEKFVVALAGKMSIRTQGPINLSNNSEPEPDLAIMKLSDRRYKDRHPNPTEIYLVIEVSDSTLAKDQTIKKKLYADAGIPEYWIVNIPEKQVEIYSNPKKGDYKNLATIDSGKVKFEKLNSLVEFDVKMLF